MTEVAAVGAPAESGVILMPVSPAPTAHAVVTVATGEVGAHVGISYQVDDAGARRHLHLAWHHRLRNDDALEDDVLWVVPGVDEIALADVSNAAYLIARQHADGRIPYAFQKGAARFTDGGVLELNGSLGLTCATFIELVFASADVILLNTPTWDTGRSPERTAEDDAAQRKLVDYLRRTRGAEAHATLVENEGPCTRVRAEEVAAASGMTGHPIPFARAEPEGRRILEAVRRPRVAAASDPAVLPPPAQPVFQVTPPDGGDRPVAPVVDA
ncbi:hypothetical protein [Sorangium sp. So ce861]|uniref:hypothetical protein n=1 Tax=Sorangium sp. So ce861 TaxID=3133323 RepID=UPI003F5F2BB1